MSILCLWAPQEFIFGNRTYMFNTGDLGRWREDGTLEHLGRVDDKVKVKVRCI